MSILHLISQDGFIAVNKRLISLFGFYEAALVGLFASVHNYNETINPNYDGWFYVTYDKIEKELKLSDYVAKKPIDNLIAQGIFFEKREGIPLRRFFKFNKEKLLDCLLPRNSGTGNPETQEQENQKLGHNEPSNLATGAGDSGGQGLEKVVGNKNTNKNTSLSSDQAKWKKLKERKDYDFEIDVTDAREWYNDQDNMKISFDNFLKTWAGKPDNRILKPKSSMPVEIYTETPEIKEVRGQIKFWLHNSGHQGAAKYFINAKIEKTEEGFAVYASDAKALDYQTILSKINLQIIINDESK